MRGELALQCKIQNAHKRLLESHRLWHQTLNNYFDPEGFRVNLNATIQALRNLTFALQYEKSNFSDFDEWYSKWQDKMKQDPVLRWLNSARVEIVHQKDLETKSIARVTVLAYIEIFKADISIPVDIPDYMIAFYLLKEGYINKHIIDKDFILKVERRWILDSLDEYEVLDALAYCYGFMYRLLKEAHEMLDSNIDICSVNDELHSNIDIPHNDLGIPSCMELSNKVRTKNLALKSLLPKEIDQITVEINEEKVKKAVQRYRIEKFPSTNISEKKNLIEFAKSLLEMAKKVLAKDGYHMPFLFLINDKGSINLQCLELPEEKSGKYVMMQHIAELVKKNNSSGVILLVESWLTEDIDSYMKGIPTQQHKNKKECLIVYVVTKDGIKTSFTTVFTKNILGKIKFEGTVESELGIEGALAPVLELWK